MAFYEHKNSFNFRKVEVEDLPFLKNLKDESWFGTVHTSCLNMTDQKKWFERISGDPSCLFFIYGNSSIDLDLGIFGITNIDPLNRSCEFTHSLYAPYRGRGWGFLSLQAGIDMAFEVFNLRRIETWILSNNQAEIKSVLKVGFREEGCKRAAVYKCGEYLDCKLFGLMRDEWDTQPGTPRNHNYRPKNQLVDR